MDSLDLLLRSLPLLLKGALVTLKLLGVAATLSFSMGAVMGILTCERVKIPWLSRLVRSITFTLRAIPFFVQLLLVYFVLPELLGCNLGPFAASVIALGACSSGYVAQIVRCGLNAVPPTQWEGAFVLGLGPMRTLWHIILPQMVRNLLPAFNNELEQLLKSTAIVSSIGMLELTRMGMNIVSREMEPVTIYLTLALFYFSMSAGLGWLTKRLERRLAYA